MNCGSDTREIVFALAETGKSIGVLAVNGLVGVSITIENFGPLPQPVSWAIGFQAPIILFNKRTEGTLDIPPHKNMKIKSKVPLGLGPITIIVTVNGMETAYTGFLAGFIIFNFKKG
jgi:hypothetical protein